MFSLPRILLPVDFSERSNSAARYARFLAAKFNSEVDVVHVVDVRTYGLLALEPAEGPTGQEHLAAGENLDAFISAHLGDVKTRTAVLYGDPAREITKYAHQHLASLVVMPTHGRGPFRQFLLGSVTAKVLHDADCPVWTGVHDENSPVRDPLKFECILCAVDLSEAAVRPITWAWEFSQALGAGAALLHVAPDWGVENPQFFNGKVREHLMRKWTEELERLQQAAGSKAEVHIREGEIARTTAAAAQELKADLVVIGRGAASGTLGRLRTFSYSIIRQSPCPVVSV